MSISIKQAIVVLAAAGALALSGCGDTTTQQPGDPAPTQEPLPGEDPQPTP